MERGHVHSWSYPVGMLIAETAIARARQAQDRAGEATMMQMVIASALDKKAARHMTKLTKELSGVEAVPGNEQ